MNNNKHPQEDKTQDETRIGYFMVMGMWVVVLGLGTLLIHNYLERKHNPNNRIVTSTADGKRSITLEGGRYGHYRLTGSINGAEADFLVDTGASSVSIPEEVAARAGLVRGAEIALNTANGIGVGYRTSIDELRIGDITIRNAIAHINPGLSDDVLLGMSVLGQFELVQRGNQLVIREP